MQTGAEVSAHILQKVEADPEFRAQLIADPKGVIEAETGRELPDEGLVFVQEAIATAQKSVPSVDTSLTEDELVQVMGGAIVGGGSCPDDLRNAQWHSCYYQ